MEQTLETGIYCFLDTNTLIHFHTFDEVDWVSIVKVKPVYLVITSIVMSELDKHKNDSSNEWRQKRARKLLEKLKILETVMTGQQVMIRPNVYLMDIVQEPYIDWREKGLDQHVNDDRLIASIINFREADASKQVLLITNDFTPRRKAQGYQIPTLNPDGLIKPIERLSPEAKRIQELERENSTLRNQIPVLTFGFYENGGILHIVKRSQASAKFGGHSDEEINRLVAEKQQELINVVEKLSSEDAQNFHEKCANYIEKFHLALQIERSCDYGQRYELTFAIQNDGTVPAEDLQVSLQFPTGCCFISTSMEKYRDMFAREAFPEKPVPPQPEIKSSYRQPSSLPNFDHLITAIRPQHSVIESPPKPRGPSYDYRKDPTKVCYLHPKLPHKQRWIMDAVVVYVPPSTKRAFEIAYSIYADNLPQPINQTLNVVLEA